MVAPVSFRASDVRVGRPRTGKTRGVGTRSMASVAAAVAEYDAWCEAHGGAGAFAEEAEAVDRLRRALDVAFEDAERSSSPLDALIETARALLDDDPRSSATVPDERWDETRRASTRATRAGGGRDHAVAAFVRVRISRDRRTPAVACAVLRAFARAAEPPRDAFVAVLERLHVRAGFGASFGGEPVHSAAEALGWRPPPSASARCRPRGGGATPRSTRWTRTLCRRRGDRDRSGAHAFATEGEDEFFRGLPEGLPRGLPGFRVGRPRRRRGGARLPPKRRVFSRSTRLPRRERERERERARRWQTRERHHRCTRRASVSRVGGSGPSPETLRLAAAATRARRADDVETLFRVATTVESNDVGDSITIHDDAVTTAPLSVVGAVVLAGAWLVAAEEKTPFPEPFATDVASPCRSAEASFRKRPERVAEHVAAAFAAADGESLWETVPSSSRDSVRSALNAAVVHFAAIAFRRCGEKGAAPREEDVSLKRGNAAPRRGDDKKVETKNVGDVGEARRRRAFARARRSGERAWSARPVLRFGSSRGSRTRVC